MRGNDIYKLFDDMYQIMQINIGWSRLTSIEIAHAVFATFSSVKFSLFEYFALYFAVD